jgi:hypothetical protein
MRALKVVVVLMLLCASSALAQKPVFEIGAQAGYTISTNIDMGAEIDGRTYDKIGPKDAFSWDVIAAVVLPSGWEIGFLWARQQTDLELSGPSGAETVSSLDVDNYHGILAYNFPTAGMARPFLFGGIGATSYGGVTVNGVSSDGDKQFSSTWGAGLKLMPPGKPIGAKLMFRWTPTYIKTDPDDVWCDPYWGCYAYGDPQYSHQIEFSGGVLFRFGGK